jgi:NADH:ubiquinone oxidoreductase subunit H
MPALRPLALVSLLVSVTACQAREVPELLTLGEVVPASVAVGEQIDVFGSNLPVGAVRRAEVVLEGALHRVGRPTLRDQTITVEHVTLERDRVRFELDPALADRLTGRGDEARRTTFRGRVSLRVLGVTDAIPLEGTVRDEVVLDVVPRPPRSAVTEALADDAAGAQAALGLELSATAAPDGLEVRGVRSGSPAERAGLVAGDRLESFDGVRVATAADVLPSGEEPRATAVVVRGGERLQAELPIEGWRADARSDLAAVGALLASVGVVILALGTRLGSVVTWLAARVAAGLASERSQHGLMGAFARVVRREGSGAGVSPWGGAVPLVAALSMGIVVALVPWLELRGRLALDAGQLFVASFAAYATAALLTGGPGKVGTSGGDAPRAYARHLAAAGRVVACALPAAAALGAIVLASGSVRLMDIIATQSGPETGWLETGGWPWAWHALRSPQLFGLFCLFFVGAFIDASRVEEVAGADSPARERRVRGAMFVFVETANLGVMSALAVAAFLGGWTLPGVSRHTLEGSSLAQMAASLVFVAKWIAVGATVLVLRASLPRIRPSLIPRLFLRGFVPAAFVALGLAVLAARFPPLPSTERAVALLTLAVSVALASAIAFAVRGAIVGDRDASRLRARVNPFL